MLQRIGKTIRGWFSRSPNATATGLGNSPDSGLEQLRNQHEQLRNEAHNEVGEVLTCTEDATLSVCGNLDRVVKEAQSFIGDIKSRLGSMETDGNGGVSATLDRQCALVKTFIEELREGVQMQREASKRMLATSQQVSRAAESVAQISTATKVLCLNTMIEAGRLGDVGQPMIVIADQMRTLSSQIGDSNEEISQLMSALLPTLQDVDTSSAQVDKRAATFSADFEVQAEEVGVIASQLRETTEAVLGGSDQKLDVILGSSRSALESLQTQDLVSQRLRRVLQLLDRSPAAAATVEPAENNEPDTEETPPTDKPDVYLSESIGGEEKRELEAGDMMMF